MKLSKKKKESKKNDSETHPKSLNIDDKMKAIKY